MPLSFPLSTVTRMIRSYTDFKAVAGVCVPDLYRPKRSMRCTLLLMASVGFSSIVFADSLAARDHDVLKTALQASCQYQRKHPEAGKEVLESTSAPLGDDHQSHLLNAVGSDDPYTAAMMNLLQRNARPQRLPSQITCSGQILASRKAIETAFKGDAIPPRWDGFYRAFPGAKSRGVVSLPGYTRSGERAIVYRASVCGGTCGSGHLLEFRRERGQWVFDKAITVWIS